MFLDDQALTRGESSQPLISMCGSADSWRCNGRHRNKEHLRFVAQRPCLILRSHAVGPAPPALCPGAGAGPQGQRRIRGAALP